MCLGLLLRIGKIEYMSIQELQTIDLHWEIIGKIEGITAKITCPKKIPFLDTNSPLGLGF
jgi:hypothetical protein